MILIYLARAGSVEDFCFGVWPVLLPNKLEADELILVFGERKDVVLVLKYKNLINKISFFFDSSINIDTCRIDKQNKKDHETYQ